MLETPSEGLLALLSSSSTSYNFYDIFRLDHPYFPKLEQSLLLLFDFVCESWQMGKHNCSTS